MTDYPPSIAVYHAACDEIRGWMPDWISQHDFDRLSLEHQPQQKRVVAYTGETMMLPFFGDPNLALLLAMRDHGLIEARQRRGVVYYKTSGSAEQPGQTVRAE